MPSNAQIEVNRDRKLPNKRLLLLVDKLFVEKFRTDVTFEVEGQRVEAHKCILGAACHYFDTMLFGHVNEAEMQIITLSSTPLKQFKEVVKFIYGRDVKLDDWDMDDVYQLYSLAHEYTFSQLMEVVEKFIIESQFTIDNVGKMFDFAKTHGAVNLREKCEYFAATNSDDILSNLDVFATYSVDFLDRIITRLWASEEAVFEAIWHWQRKRSKEERKSIMSKVKWDLLPSHYSVTILKMLLSEPAPAHFDTNLSSVLNTQRDAVPQVTGRDYIERVKAAWPPCKAIVPSRRSVLAVVTSNYADEICSQSMSSSMKLVGRRGCAKRVTVLYKRPVVVKKIRFRQVPYAVPHITINGKQVDAGTSTVHWEGQVLRQMTLLNSTASRELSIEFTKCMNKDFNLFDFQSYAVREENPESDEELSV